jgi:hypothetical protein
MDYYTKCEIILKWAKFKPKFDTSFIHNVMDYESERGEFTPAQEIAIDNIIKKWCIKLKK